MRMVLMLSFFLFIQLSEFWSGISTSDVWEYFSNKIIPVIKNWQLECAVTSPSTSQSQIKSVDKQQELISDDATIINEMFAGLVARLEDGVPVCEVSYFRRGQTTNYVCVCIGIASYQSIGGKC